MNPNRHPLRLPEHVVALISSTVRTYFGPFCRVLIFGSQVDLSKRGGDIDLLVESPLSGETLFEAKINTLTALHLRLGQDEKVDIVTTFCASEDGRLIVREALRMGVWL